MSIEVLYEDNHLLAIHKPAGIATMGAGAGVTTLLDEARAYVAEKYNKPGNVYLGVVSRLDSPVTGVCLLARTSKAASRLAAAFRNRDVDKQYLAAVEGELPDSHATLVHYLRKDERHRKVHVTTLNATDAQRAELSYHSLGVGPRGSLALVQLQTGRKHQIRVQLAKIGSPIIGDRKYGAQTPLAPRDQPAIALHSWRLRIEHPVKREPLTIIAPIPRSWSKVWPLSDEQTQAQADVLKSP